MALMHHDTTGTQTDSVKPLSRKKLKQLMRQQHGALTSRAMFARTGRLNAGIRKEIAAAVAKRKTDLEAAESVKAGKFSYSLSDKSSDKAEEAKPSIFKRFGKFFGNLQRKADRESARGK